MVTTSVVTSRRNSRQVVIVSVPFYAINSANGPVGKQVLRAVRCLGMSNDSNTLQTALLAL